MWQQTRFGTKGEIFGIIEKPYKLSSQNSLVVTFPGLGQAMSEKNYLFSNLRKRLSAIGQWQLQFDYYGHGDSYGELGDVTITSMVDNSIEVINSVVKDNKPKCIYLVGNALGAVIAQKVANMLEYTLNITCVPILISPPLNLPKVMDVLEKEIIEKIEREGKLDSQLLVPGYDYYTLSDFDIDKYKYFTSLGAHMLYLHGQCISKNMLDELEQLNPFEIIFGSKQCGYIIFGEKDNESINKSMNLSKFKKFSLKNVMYYYQHPSAMDELIDLIQLIIKKNEKEL
ncbi:serine aminopeptidase domain-containing protein [Cytobacillus oceanisediminis]|uniref:serine aminopeptidase domain-containing protein n=1 Tax=Cytobacillus oceanisediminis TaxID=665099 RepID=UPI001C2188B2|nr:alpha/beta hydrolase [Cytobacillus oceanisediminis]MBU8772112.1 lysophospholipase [Cytobacillus oceanisediminis]